MKSYTKLTLSTIAFAVIVSLQSFILYQQSQANQTVQQKVDKLQNQVDQARESNQELLQKIEKLESSLELRPRSLLSMN
ncbi:hypothetical protein AWH61_13345 [Alteromonas sp. W12]|uniref:hypothetical protein n=1 Tax=Alteromonas sp. W12 TaxID=1772289 RepID=UPI000948C32F|nr:hypothetical protein [Alteromonas sp. W12]OLF74201.1 hypothetical protein AWH61_13345 [Alteromonas sp. W12]